MTVKKLIGELQKFDLDIEVYTEYEWSSGISKVNSMSIESNDGVPILLLSDYVKNSNHLLDCLSYFTYDKNVGQKGTSNTV